MLVARLKPAGRHGAGNWVGVSLNRTATVIVALHDFDCFPQGEGCGPFGNVGVALGGGQFPVTRQKAVPGKVAVLRAFLCYYVKCKGEFHVACVLVA